ESAEEAVRGADIVVEATRLERPEVLVHDAWLAPGALLVTYGWVMAVDAALPFRVSKLVVDDWAQCQLGGQLHPLIASRAPRRAAARARARGDRRDRARRAAGTRERRGAHHLLASRLCHQ